MALLIVPAFPIAMGSSAVSSTTTSTGCSVKVGNAIGPYLLGTTVKAYFTLSPSTSCTGSGSYTLKTSSGTVVKTGAWSCTTSSPCNNEVFFHYYYSAVTGPWVKCSTTSPCYFMLQATFSGPNAVSTMVMDSFSVI